MEARLHQQEREETYRYYLTDALKAIAENTANYMGFNGMVTCGAQMKSRFYDLLHMESKKETVTVPDDSRTAEQIARDMFKRVMKAR